MARSARLCLAKLRGLERASLRTPSRVASLSDIDFEELSGRIDFDNLRETPGWAAVRSAGFGSQYNFRMKHDYHVVYAPIEDGWIMATVPELPGAVTQGRDMEEVRANIREAIELVLQAYRENAVKREIKETTARTICDQLGIPRP